MKKLLFLSFLLVSLNINASSDLRERIPTSDLDFDFLRVKVRELLNDAVATAVLFDEEIIKNGDQDKFDEMPTKRLKIGLNALVSGDQKRFGENIEGLQFSCRRFWENQVGNFVLVFRALRLLGCLSIGRGLRTLGLGIAGATAQCHGSCQQDCEESG